MTVTSTSSSLEMIQESVSTMVTGVEKSQFARVCTHFYINLNFDDFVHRLLCAQRSFAPTPSLSHMAKSERTRTTLHQKPTTAVTVDMSCVVLGTEHACTQVSGMESHLSATRVSY